ncbi:hypothetical protein BN1012_Phect2626 [Candidatus Phaeomarinobacter ectocarpi]|uniref:Uncharacterized protein n=1 Tax=Candidatus Phaeomarinibacter ectocarpi TaxID=1458461 RepID=X5MGY5_9HYPH|nr:hypothetical protein [Candidatus Phaeomarinobacter ectocarpi]CDO60839.1 hypothetical protein BN1012_Phect2626 [Candidatus Phaeomarinobacter ectocarpi]
MTQSVNLNTPKADKKPGLGERILKALCAAEGSLTYKQLVDLTKPKRGTDVTAAVSRLITAKSVKRLSKGVYMATSQGHKRLRDGFRPGIVRPFTAPPKPRAKSFRHRVWHALRITKKSSTNALVIAASSSGKKTDIDAARRYLNALANVGYLKKFPSNEPGETRWLLLNDTGRIAPSWNPTTRSVYDHNTRERRVIEGAPS